jgi:hypothetical protein
MSIACAGDRSGRWSIPASARRVTAPGTEGVCRIPRQLVGNAGVVFTNRYSPGLTASTTPRAWRMPLKENCDVNGM